MHTQIYLCGGNIKYFPTSDPNQRKSHWQLFLALMLSLQIRTTKHSMSTEAMSTEAFFD